MTQAIQTPLGFGLYFLVGPTAVGKTALALETAEQLGADILSVDAYCVYRGMDIGTAKPTARERSRVRHHGIDLVEVTEAFSVEQYLSHAQAVVEAARQADRPLLVVGGSGFYLKSFFAPVMDGVEIPPEVRARVETLAADGGLPALQAALRPLARDALQPIDWDNPRRVQMGLLRCLASGLTLGQVQARFAAQPTPYAGVRKEVCLLERPAEELRVRIAQRVDAMLAAGLVEEVEGLRGAGLEGNPTAAAAIGYRETLEYLRGALPDRASLREAIVRHTRQLARRQRTWFRRQVPVDRVLAAAGASPGKAFPRRVT
ncbi:MAG: tRNA (adenosine(37)-N6)-dimethylallyltransferase MiaA [Verrucomicrobiota bacterium]